MKWLLIGLGLSLLPIWRDDSSNNGMNTWEALRYFATTKREHIPYEEALWKSKDAYYNSYLEKGITYLGS